MTADTIPTAIGAAAVFHRLALGLMVRDAVDNRGATGSLLVGWEASGHLLPSTFSHTRPDAPRSANRMRAWPCVDFERTSESRYRLRATPALPAELVVRVYDPARRHVSRRISIALWPYHRLVDERSGSVVPVAARTIQVWLLPGAGYPLARGTTAIRGRVERDGLPVPWTRIAAVDALDAGTTLGWTHGDDRGEFLLILTGTNQNPVESTVDVRLIVHGPAQMPTGTPPDPPVEAAQPPVPPGTPGDLDLPVLRGETIPASYLPNAAPAVQLKVHVGAELNHPVAVPFRP